MYLHLDRIIEALDNLKYVHQFFGTSFLVFKRAQLPVGAPIPFPINAEDKRFLNQYYRVPQGTKNHPYFRVFRLSDPTKYWLKYDYASSGLQSTRTRNFPRVFLHQKKTDLWGWANNYVHELAGGLTKKVPAFHLAVWLYRDQEWPMTSVPEDILNTFFSDFFITEEEKKGIFDTRIPESALSEHLFQKTVVTWEDIRRTYQVTPPPDAPQEEGGALTYLEVNGVGPAKSIAFAPGDRLSLLTGDNGLGKTFLLECAWWALTGEWTDLDAYPRDDVPPEDANIVFEIAGETNTQRKKITYDWDSRYWPSPEKRPTIPGLLVYARVDGAIALWDPVGNVPSRSTAYTSSARSFVLSNQEVWNGSTEGSNSQGQMRTNGLIRDWVDWQQSKSPYFETLKKVLNRLSPADLGPLEPGGVQRLPRDPRKIPTIRLPYGEVPVLYAAAGVRRILALSYLLVWAWEEHKIAAAQSRKDPQRRMVVLIDEIEAHLHPQWQRRILPALLDVGEDLSSDLQVQFLVATHSPLVMASIEPHFNVSTDKIFHLDLVRTDLITRSVEIKEIEFYKRGPVDAWLMSEIFDLGQAHSVEAEQAMLDAKAIQAQKSPDPENIREINERLSQYLSADNEFWPRWRFFAMKHGVL